MAESDQTSSFHVHAVHKLHQYRQSVATKPYGARGKGQVRCPLCLLATKNCNCDIREQVSSKAAFMLIMFDDEVLKPSNTGRLIADIIPDTHAFIWSRTEPNPAMLSMLEDSRYQPVVVFPSDYRVGDEVLLTAEHVPALAQSAGEQSLLFVLLDGSWREAKKMFRKSDYLRGLPLLSFRPDGSAKYDLRKGSHDFQWSTAEVAMMAIESLGEEHNAKILQAWFELFVEASKYGRSSVRADTLRPLEQLRKAYRQMF